MIMKDIEKVNDKPEVEIIFVYGFMFTLTVVIIYSLKKRNDIISSNVHVIYNDM